MPAASASAVFGRMPTAMTTRSASMVVPLLKRTALTLPSSLPMISSVTSPIKNLSHALVAIAEAAFLQFYLTDVPITTQPDGQRSHSCHANEGRSLLLDPAIHHR